MAHHSFGNNAGEEGRNTGIQNARVVNAHKPSDYETHWNDALSKHIAGAAIKKAQNSARATSLQPPKGNNMEPIKGPLETDFETKKSVQARVSNIPGTSKENEVLENLHYEELFRQQEIARRLSIQQQQTVLRAEHAMKTASRNSIKKIKRLPRFTMWMGIGVAFSAYISFQLFFAVFSLVGFGSQGVVKHFQNETIVGKVIGWIVDVDKYFPGKEIGMLFLGLNMILTFMIVIGFWLWYKFNGIHPFKGTLRFFISSLFIIYNILPGINFVPWLVLWVAYINFSSVFTKD